jgi:hypothetical protein
MSANFLRVPVPQLVALIVAAAFFAPASAAQDQKAANDYTGIAVQTIQPEKDPKTGFVIGGKNATALILGLTEIYGRRITDLEKDMRPGAYATKGFLGSDERLVDLLAEDNRYVVDELGLTHQELGKHLRALGEISSKVGGKEFRYQGRRFKGTVRSSQWHQASPFRDGTITNGLAIIDNLDNEKRIEYSLLMPDLIERYGFYEGKGTPYRLEPKKILEVLDFVKPGK